MDDGRATSLCIPCGLRTSVHSFTLSMDDLYGQIRSWLFLDTINTYIYTNFFFTKKIGGAIAPHGQSLPPSIGWVDNFSTPQARVGL